MDENKLKPYADITVVTGKYMKDGKERNRYHKVGTLFASPHFSNMTIKLDSLPTGDGWLKVFPRETANQPATEQPGYDKARATAQRISGRQDVVVEDIGDAPINLDDIPF